MLSRLVEVYVQIETIEAYVPSPLAQNPLLLPAAKMLILRSRFWGGGDIFIACHVVELPIHTVSIPLMLPITANNVVPWVWPIEDSPTTQANNT